MKQFSLISWFIFLLLPFAVAQELTLLQLPEDQVPTQKMNPLLEYVLADDTSGLCDLLAEGMNPNYILEDGQTALHYTTNPEIASLLLDYGAEINAKDDFHNTPLHHTVSDLNQSLTKLLLEKGADPNIQNKSYYTPLLLCLEGDKWLKLRANIASILLEYEAEPNVRTQRFENTPLYFAIQSKNTQAVKSLLEYETNLNGPQGEGGAPLDLASQIGHMDIIKLLKQAGASHLRLREQLLQAMYENDLASIQDFMEASLDLNFRFKDIQLSPLEAGIKHMQSPEVVELFLRHGAMPNFSDSIVSSTPLHLAIDTQSELAIVKLLLEHDADHKIVDKTAKSILYKAVEKQDIQLVKLLLEHGADSSFTFEDKSIIDLVEETGDDKLIELFKGVK